MKLLKRTKIKPAEKYKVHALALAYPWPPLEEYEALKASIKTNGVIRPVAVLEDGTLVDGKTRIKACADEEMECPAEVMRFENEGELEQFILACNSDVQHRTPDQIAAINVGYFYPRYQEAAKEAHAAGSVKGGSKKKNKAGSNWTRPSQPEQSQRVSERMAADYRLSGYRVKMAIRLFQHAPDLLGRVTTRELTLAEACHDLDDRERAKKKPAAPEKPAPRVKEGQGPNDSLGPDEHDKLVWLVDNAITPFINDEETFFRKERAAAWRALADMCEEQAQEIEKGGVEKRKR